MIQNTEPIITACTHRAEERIRSITAPDTIEAAVQENSRNAAQNTPVIRSDRLVPMFCDQGRFAAPASWFSPPKNGKLGKAQ